MNEALDERDWFVTNTEFLEEMLLRMICLCVCVCVGLTASKAKLELQKHVAFLDNQEQACVFETTLVGMTPHYNKFARVASHSDKPRSNDHFRPFSSAFAELPTRVLP